MLSPATELNPEAAQALLRAFLTTSCNPEPHGWATVISAVHANRGSYASGYTLSRGDHFVTIEASKTGLWKCVYGSVEGAYEPVELFNSFTLPGVDAFAALLEPALRALGEMVAPLDATIQYRQHAERRANAALSEALGRAGFDIAAHDFADPRGMNQGGAIARFDSIGIDDSTVTLFIDSGNWALEFWDPVHDAFEVSLDAHKLEAIDTTEVVNEIAEAVTAWVAERRPSLTP